ncbi:MAG: hypothetical protein OWR62_09075 [Sulfobacillus thermotolerans]|uniref:ATPase BadF/BadG/BcrA/BcrD type domain-containing protein n=1 Tax=Sulfobacillus thermotolerans TaxID=338644 RepID=A0ABM6RT77_9FIRM|nr:hypothetical protein BXT84_11510 [Sulfobacillus thermotolerans]MCY0908527.1 hypothetical protein [Sulfobacillus thermotolerans]
MWGIDGGGSTTRGVRCERIHDCGPVVAQGPSNILAVGQVTAYQAMAQVLEVLNPSPQESGLVGIAGADRPAVWESWQAFFRDRHLDHTWIVGDYWLPWAALTGGADGTIVILGTGSLVFSVCQGKIERRGGYGWKLGDTGSGLWLGQQGLRLAVQALEGTGEPTALAEAALQWAQARDVVGLINYLYDPSRPVRAPADFAPLVFALAREGDLVSQKLLTEEAYGIVRMVDSAPACSLVGLSGGLAKAWEPYVRTLRPSWRVISENPVYGAIRLGALWEQEGRPYHIEPSH